MYTKINAYLGLHSTKGPQHPETKEALQALSLASGGQVRPLRDDTEFRLDQLATRVADIYEKKPYFQPHIGIWSGNNPYTLSWSQDTISDDKSFSGNSIQEVFQKAYDFLDTIPSLQEREEAEFQVALGKLIEQGRSITVNIDPLIELSKKLASNALTAS